MGQYKKILAASLVVLASIIFSAIITNNTYALVQVGDLVELESAISDGESNIEITANLGVNEGITLPENKTITIDGKNHTLTRMGLYLGSFFTVPETSELIINNLKLDGSAPDWSVDLNEGSITYAFNDSHTRSYGVYPVSVGDNDIVATSALITNNGTLRINGSTLKDAYSDAGAAAIYSTGSLYIDNSVISHNSSGSTYGGAIYATNESGTFSIQNSTFENNNVHGNIRWGSGGGLYVTEMKTITIKNNIFKNNAACSNGGAIHIITADTATIENNQFLNNTVGNDGSSIMIGASGSHVNHKGKLSLKNNTFDGGMSLAYYYDADDGAYGNAEGALSAYGSGFEEISLNGDKFTNNKANFGVAFTIYNDEEPVYDTIIKKVTVTNVTAEGNEAPQKRPGNIVAVEKIQGQVIIDSLTYKNNFGYSYILLNDYAEIRNSTFTNNNGCANGAIRAKDNDELMVRDTTISDNNGPNAGAGIFLRYDTEGSLATLKNLTITGNKTVSSGAGISIAQNSVATTKIIDTKIENNEAGKNGGGIMLSTSTDKIDGRGTVEISGNTVIKNNKATQLGGGISFKSRSFFNVTVDNGVAIYDNTADEGGDDIYYPAKDEYTNDFEGFTIIKAADMNVPGITGWYEDAPDARYSEDNAVESTAIDLAATDEPYYLKAVTDESYVEPDDNPSTVDTITARIVLAVVSIAAIGIGTYVAIAKRR